MKITIKNKEITLKKGFRSLIMFEKAKGGQFESKTLSDLILYFYCVVVSSDLSLDLTFDEFIEWLDENQQELLNFSNMIIREGEKDKLTAGDAKKKVTRKAKE